MKLLILLLTGYNRLLISYYACLLLYLLLFLLTSFFPLFLWIDIEPREGRSPITGWKSSCAEQCVHMEEEFRHSRERLIYGALSHFKVKYGKPSFILLPYRCFSNYICYWFFSFVFKIFIERYICDCLFENDNTSMYSQQQNNLRV